MVPDSPATAVAGESWAVSRVLHAVPTYWPAVRYGGTIASVHALSRALVCAGHHVDVVTTVVDGPTDLDLARDVAVDRDGVQVWYSAVPAFRRIYWSPGLSRNAQFLLGRCDVAHLHSVFLWPTLRVARLAAARGVPYVVSPRGMLVPELLAARGALRKRAWIALFEAHTLRRAAAIHVTSRREADDLARLGIARLPPVLTIPNGVDLPRDPGVVRGRRLVFIGRLCSKKRPDWAVRALAESGAPGLDFVGPDEERLEPGLRKLASELGVADRVAFHGLLGPVERDALLWRAAALLLPSCSENFGNVVAEAMACACPVVTTTAVGAAECVVAADAGAIADSVDSFAAATRALMAASGAAIASGSRGRHYVQHQLTWPAVASRMQVMYESIAGKARAR